MKRRNLNISNGLRDSFTSRVGIFCAAVIMSLLGGCGLVRDEISECVPAGSDDSDKIILQFNMESGANLTRTRSDSYHEEIDSEWPTFEDQIYVRDLGLFIFLGSGDDAPLIARNTSIADSSNPYEMITGSNGYYTITMSVDRDEIDERISEDDTSVDFRILILANCYSPGESGGGDFSNLNADLRSGEEDASTFGDVMKVASNWGFIISEIYSPNEGDSLASGLWKGYIPMFGTNTFNVTTETLHTSTMGDQIYLGEVNLLRALAKARVIDNIANKVNGYPRIAEASIYSQTNMAYSLPLNATSYKDGQQIHNTTQIHVHDRYGANVAWYDYKLGTLSSGSDTRIGYIPEQRIETDLPAFYVKVQTGSGSSDYQEYVVPMSGYKNYQGQQDFEFGSYIIRNHIYTLSVEDVETGGAASILLTVDDWVAEEDYELDYMNIPVVDKTITWEAGTYSNNNVTDGELTINSFDEGNVSPAVCTFRLSRPINGTWIANLLTIEGEEGAFTFQVDDGMGGVMPATTVTGTIDGTTDAVLNIIPTNTAPSQKNVAILQITVALVDGTYMVADICEEGYSNYKIIQNAN